MPKGKEIIIDYQVYRLYFTTKTLAIRILYHKSCCVKLILSRLRPNISSSFRTKVNAHERKRGTGSSCAIRTCTISLDDTHRATLLISSLVLCKSLTQETVYLRSNEVPRSQHNVTTPRNRYELCVWNLLTCLLCILMVCQRIVHCVDQKGRNTNLMKGMPEADRQDQWLGRFARGSDLAPIERRKPLAVGWMDGSSL